jgi:hypothetical protein
MTKLIITLAERIEQAKEQPIIVSLQAVAELRRLIEMNAELVEVLQAASEHLDYTGYGDSWDADRAHHARLPERISEAITKATGETK